jgi:hypothetical protein
LRCLSADAAFEGCSSFQIVAPLATARRYFRGENKIGEKVMRYMFAWLLGVPFSLIVLWFLVGHACR